MEGVSEQRAVFARCVKATALSMVMAAKLGVPDRTNSILEWAAKRSAATSANYERDAWRLVTPGNGCKAALVNLRTWHHCDSGAHPSALRATFATTSAASDQGRSRTPPEPAHCCNCHSCHAKAAWMSPSATPSTQEKFVLKRVACDQGVCQKAVCQRVV